MKCKHCGSENADDAVFCMNCGEDLKKKSSGKKLLVPCIIILAIIVALGILWFLKMKNDKEKESMVEVTTEAETDAQVKSTSEAINDDSDDDDQGFYDESETETDTDWESGNEDFDGKIQYIKDEYKEIQSNLGNYEKEHIEQATFYSQDNDLRKVKVKSDYGYLFGDYFEDCQIEIFYEGGEPFFIFASMETGWEVRFYYWEGELIRWIDETGETTDYYEETEDGADLYENALQVYEDFLYDAE